MATQIIITSGKFILKAEHIAQTVTQDYWRIHLYGPKGYFCIENYSLKMPNGDDVNENNIEDL